MSATTQTIKADDPWQIAKSRFLEDLDPSERQLFENATLENLYYSTSNLERADAEESKTRNVARKLGPLVSAIESYGSALDTYAQIAPLYLAPIWGSIRVLLVLAKKHGKFFEKVLDTLNRIGDILPRFRDYERIYDTRKHQRLTQALSNAYLDIIVLCTEWRKLLSEQKTSSLKRLFKPLSSNKTFDEAVERFRQHREAVREEAKICHQIENAEHRHAQVVLSAAEQRRKLLSTLSGVDCGPRHRKLKAARHEGTGIWLPARPEYSRWALASTSSILCCHGIPGSGKSVLSSSIIDSLSASKIIAFYYCDYADKRTLEPPNVFSTLARQLLEKVSEIPEDLAAAITSADHDGEKMTDHAAAFSILEKCIAITARPVYLVLDGLDESSERSQKIICQGLAKVRSNVAVPVKLFITSRDDLKSFLSLDSNIYVERIALSSTAIALDVESYVKAVTHRRIVDGSLVLLDPKLEEVIVQELVEGSKGMFLWVKFQLQDLCEQESDHGIRAVLKNLPQNLSETYDRLLNRIEGAGRREMIEKMFKWIACARQPLHVNEIREAVAFSLYDIEWVEEKLVTDFSRLVRACGNLVVVDNKTQIVQLAHYTVQQYLLDVGENCFHFSPSEANTLVGEVAIAYLSFSNFEIQITKYKENVHTNLISLGNLAHKGLLIPDEIPGYKMFQALKDLRNPTSTIRQVDMSKFAPPSNRKSEDLSRYHLLPYIISHWLWHTVSFETDTLQNSGDDRINRRAHLFKNLVIWKILPFDFRPWGQLDGPDAEVACYAMLGWALMANHASLINMVYAGNTPLMSLDPILERLGSVCSRDDMTFYEYALHLDKNQGRRGTMISRETLERFAIFGEDSHNIKEPIDEWLLSRLFNACRRGYLAVITTAYRLGNWPEDLTLQLGIVAAESGQLQILQGLGVCNGVLKEAFFYITKMCTLDNKMWYLSALEHAIYNGHCDVVIELVAIGFPTDNVFAHTLTYSEALHSAVCKNKAGTVASHLFLRRSSKHAYNNLGREKATDIESSAFVLASEMGYHHVLSMFLEYGLNPNRQDIDGNTALIQAIRGSHVAVVNLLVCHNCSLEITPFGLPLTIAVCHGNLIIINLLITHGSEIFSKSTYRENSAKMALFISNTNTRGGQPCIILSPTPLYMACYYGDRAIVELLLANGVAVDLPSPSNLTRVKASKEGCVKTFDVTLQKARSDLRLPSADERASAEIALNEWASPIVVAIANGHKAIVELLLQAGAKPPSYPCPQPSQTVPLAEFLNNSTLETRQSIISNDQKLLAGEIFLRTVLSNTLQCHEVSAQVVDFCMYVGIDLSLVELRGRPLIIWAFENDAEALQEFLACECSRNDIVQRALRTTLLSTCMAEIKNSKLYGSVPERALQFITFLGSLAQEGILIIQKAFKDIIYDIVIAIYRDDNILQGSGYELLKILVSYGMKHSEEEMLNRKDFQRALVSAAKNPQLLVVLVDIFIFPSLSQESSTEIALRYAAEANDDAVFKTLWNFAEHRLKSFGLSI